MILRLLLVLGLAFALSSCGGGGGSSSTNVSSEVAKFPAPTAAPDGIHLHTLIHRRVMRLAVGDEASEARKLHQIVHGGHGRIHTVKGTPAQRSRRRKDRPVANAVGLDRVHEGLEEQVVLVEPYAIDFLHRGATLFFVMKFHECGVT